MIADESSLRSGGDQIRTLFTLIRQQDGITRQQLSDRLQIPATTLNRLINRLMNLGLIQEAGLADSSGGRRPSLYSIAETPYRLLGLDISAARSQLVLINLRLVILDQVDLPGLAELPAAGLIEQISDAIGRLLERQSVEAVHVLGLGIGWAAAADQDPDGAPDRLPVYLRDLLSRITSSWNFPVSTVRGADAALYAGLWLDRSLSDRHLLYFSIGRNIRAGLAWQGQFHQTGLTTDQVNRLKLGINRQGGARELGQIATQPAMLERYRQLKKEASLSWLDFCGAAGKGKKKALQVMREAARAVSVAVYNASLITATDDLLLGGPALNDSPELEAMIRGELSDLIEDRGTPRLLDQPHHDRLMAVGAAAYALEQMMDHRLGTDS